MFRFLHVFPVSGGGFRMMFRTRVQLNVRQQYKNYSKENPIDERRDPWDSYQRLVHK